MGRAGSLQVAQQTLALRLAAGVGLMQAFSGWGSPGLNGLPQSSQVPFRFTHQFDEDLALTSALAAKATHDLFQGLTQYLCVLTQGLGRRRAVARDRLDKAKEFFCALYSVVASVTR
jgi:hypothetical protein